MKTAAIERVLASPNLPTIPAVALRVLELMSSRDVSVREISSVIEHDPALASKVLRTVNSSYFGLARPCGSIQQALVYLGLHSLKSLVLSFTLTRSIEEGDGDVGFDFLDYWRRSIYSAAAAREIAYRSRRCDPDEAFFCALIRDIGMIALWRAYGDRYLQIVDLAKGDHNRLPAIERRTLEIDHAEVAAEMITRWRLPLAFADVIRVHHDIAGFNGEAQALARTVGLASSAAAVLAPKSKPEDLVRFRTECKEWFDIKETAASDLLSEIVAVARELSATFELETGEIPDVDGILAEAERLRKEQQLMEPAGSTAAAEDAPLELDSMPESHVFGEDLAREFQAARQAGTGSIGLMLIGVDRARTLQQSYGMGGVEAALRHTLSKLKTVLPRGAHVYRFVGAELAVLASTAEIDDLCRIAEFTKRAASEDAVDFAPATGGGFPITLSVGIATYERDPQLTSGNGIETPDQLVSGAMFALAAGRRQHDKVVVFRRELKKEYEGA